MFMRFTIIVHEIEPKALTEVHTGILVTTVRSEVHLGRVLLGTTVST